MHSLVVPACVINLFRVQGVMQGSPFNGSATPMLSMRESSISNRVSILSSAFARDCRGIHPLALQKSGQCSRRPQSTALRLLTIAKDFAWRGRNAGRVNFIAKLLPFRSHFEQIETDRK
jgi:hypothetical protein